MDQPFAGRTRYWRGTGASARPAGAHGAARAPRAARCSGDSGAARRANGTAASSRSPRPAWSATCPEAGAASRRTQPLKRPISGSGTSVPRTRAKNRRRSVKRPWACVTVSSAPLQPVGQRGTRPWPMSRRFITAITSSGWSVSASTTCARHRSAASPRARSASLIAGLLAAVLWLNRLVSGSDRRAPASRYSDRPALEPRHWLHAALPTPPATGRSTASAHGGCHPLSARARRAPRARTPSAAHSSSSDRRFGLDRRGRGDRA